MRWFVWILIIGSFGFAGEEHRVLVIGDSWTGGMTEEGLYQEVLSDNGRPDLVVQFEDTAIGGTTVAGWRTQEGLDLIAAQLTQSPNLEVVHITLSGNDFLAGQAEGGWYQGMSAEAEEAFLVQVIGDFGVIVDHITNLKADVTVLLSFYDYLNLQDLGCEGLLANLGDPTTRQLNDAMSRMEQRIAAALTSRANVVHVSHLGLLQSVYGYAPAGVAPGQLTQPGDPNLPSPTSVMGDCIHLTQQGYRTVIQNLFDAFYQFLDGQTPAPSTPGRWIPHVTAPDGGFSSVLHLYNHGVAADLRLIAYDNRGEVMAEQTLRVAAGGFERMPVSDVFTGAVSHLGVIGSDQIKVAIAYKADGFGVSAHVNAETTGGARWMVYTGETDVVFDGLAVLNLGDQAARVRLQKVEAGGFVSDEVVLADALAPRSKQLGVLSNWFAELEGAGVMVISDQPVSVLALRGSLGDASPSYLYQIVPIRLE